VDSLIGARKRTRPAADIEARLRRAGTGGDLLEHASHELSRASHHIGFAMARTEPAVRLRHIDFISLDGPRVLVVVVTTGGQILQKMVELDELSDATELTQAANYINATLQGLTLNDARAAIVERLGEERAFYDAIVARALRLAESGLAATAEAAPLHVQGAAMLFEEIAGTADAPHVTLETARTLIRIIEEKHRLVALLTECLDGLGLTVVIGTEHTSPDLQPFSVVASTYRDGDRTGLVGIIGPTRMRYHRAISAVDGLSQLMTRMLDENPS
jgi:heat-inducible transcriptional repressor